MNTPTEAGYYWCKFDGEWEVVIVNQYGDIRAFLEAMVDPLMVQEWGERIEICNSQEDLAAWLTSALWQASGIRHGIMEYQKKGPSEGMEFLQNHITKALKEYGSTN